MELMEIDPELKNKVRGKKVLLYKLNLATKSALMRLVNEGVYVSGFLLPDEQQNLLGMKYINKPMYSMKDIAGKDEFFIIDVLGDNIPVLKNFGGGGISPKYRSLGQFKG